MSRDVAQLLECLPNMHAKWVPSPVPQKLGIVVHACHPKHLEVEAGESEVQDHFPHMTSLWAASATRDPVQPKKWCSDWVPTSPSSSELLTG